MMRIAQRSDTMTEEQEFAMRHDMKMIEAERIFEANPVSTDSPDGY